MSHNQLLALPEGNYEINIDTEFVDGRLQWGEYTHKGEIDDIILFSAHICHPSLANDNCSGLALLAHLASRIAQQRTRYTYRFLFAPGTIGSVAWLARNEDLTERIRHGLVLSCVGDAGVPSYKRSRRGYEVIDRAMTHVLQHRSPSSQVSDFAPFGYDERQFCSPGFDLPVGSFQRSRFGEFPEYHTSADNLDFIAPRHLGDSYSAICEIIEVLESAHVRLRRRDPRCEPQLAKYGLYGKGADHDRALLWVLNLADGEHSLLDMAERAKMPFTIIRAAAAKLQASGLVWT
jgi:aminopeptidase-like protein